MQDTYEEGEALYFGGDYAEAEPLLRRAAEADHAHAAYLLGRCCEELGRPQEATRGTFLEEDGELQEAETWYRTALEEMAAHEDPDDRDEDYEANSQVMVNLADLADLLERTGRPDEARELRRCAAGRVAAGGGE
ncbi:tetratricopeptide repeat protein [Actinomadura montaniterrae]|uniref:Tetratricopeptide repeat protein n=1 Tax=Actinomadura montaniterrae TaxID=1803903 RepID=A0A6L3VZS7_9ACTN|nr:tetratricopeptide repeat protein [Actinomadura montaniterrae]KAB2379169.1 tetratricopeptide repeat protein [Actinomadura montaniterrae]